MANAAFAPLLLNPLCDGAEVSGPGGGFDSSAGSYGIG
jgi:hypothetical protein